MVCYTSKGGCTVTEYTVPDEILSGALGILGVGSAEAFSPCTAGEDGCIPTGMTLGRVFAPGSFAWLGYDID